MNAFKILIDRLRTGSALKIEEAFAPDFLGPEESELKFPEKVLVKGEAYVTDAHLILHLKAETVVQMPCAVCNELISVPLKIDNMYHTQPVSEIPGAIYDYSEALREALLIELPRTTECNGGDCPGRATLKPYLRSEARSERTTYLPFADVDKLQ